MAAHYVQPADPTDLSVLLLLLLLLSDANARVIYKGKVVTISNPIYAILKSTIQQQRLFLDQSHSHGAVNVANSRCSYFLISLLVLIPLLLIHLIILLPQYETTSNLEKQMEEYNALVSFKKGITSDPAGVLSSWNATIHHCQWQGVTCSSEQGQKQVISLRLSSQSLIGSLSPHLGNITHLQELNLGHNALHGTIPPELGKLQSLSILNLSDNYFTGRIPPNISNCKGLTYLDFGNNAFQGHIPNEIGSLSKLHTLYLLMNNLTGFIPPSIGNLSSLVTLAIGRNTLTGTLPDTISSIPGLQFLQVAENQLSGTIPPSIYNLSTLTFIAMATNALRGSLPPNLGLTLPRLETLYLGDNLITGSIPESLTNMSLLANLDLAYNMFTGSVPLGIGRLSRLLWFNLEGNQLGHGQANGLDFINSLSNCTGLETLDIDGNMFEGKLPVSVANLSTRLSILILGSNKIHGNIHEGISNLVGLTMLRLENNSLTGSLPGTIGRLENLQLLSVSSNKLSGPIPSSIGNLTRISDMHLDDNLLQGSVPSTLGNCKRLQFLNLSQNELNGSIPAQVITGITSLQKFLGLAGNSFTGSLPGEVGKLKNLGTMDISRNRLSGELPEELGGCESMEYLYMQGNTFQGVIPTTLINLKAIQHLDLSMNNLSGGIPDYLGNLTSLAYLNLSSNNFEGSVPQHGVFRNASAISVHGNDKLCGGAVFLQLPACPIETSSKRLGTSIIIAICVASGLLLVLVPCLFLAIQLRKRFRKVPPEVITSLDDNYMTISYKRLFDATDGFSVANMIGEGSYGSVYKGILDSQGTMVAVKVLNLERHGAPTSFLTECEALRYVRHRNLLKILTACSSIDFNGNEFKALVYEFMSKGSLEEWLHPDIEKQQNCRVLSIVDRLNISIDVASALGYLHYECQTPIVHCDLKPSNILLDDDMTAHVGDFGLAKILSGNTEDQEQTDTVGVRGSIGYVPPEYGVGCDVSVKGDVYSYGILLLEMFTGKRPTDNMFKEGTSLHSMARNAYPETVMQVVDPQLLLIQGKETSGGKLQHGSNSNIIEECLVSITGIALSCTAESPNERMEMRDVVKKIQDIRAKFLTGDGESFLTSFPCGQG
ncbi:hypothetical protein J5N97_013003 [Dioscorea zingiberensis]|uniref:Receptor kinase-like protein Xa21 n=1 Tax=Dioscorea zingiberensis TaxID=325984 RepID=A0A9D5CR29_9LILI|nr:hypothetical protein J5N97_013003 [Dioscorea zingiberensis]